MITLSELLQKREQLRIEWKQNPDKRKTIEIQGKLLSIAIEMCQSDPETRKVVEAIF